MEKKIKIKTGFLKNKNIQFKAIKTTKQIKNNIKTALLSYLKNIKDIYILDLFAGSGLMPFELYSNGAKKIILIDINKTISSLLSFNKKNLIKCYNDFQIMLTNSYNWLINSNFINISIVILDPPYNLNCYKKYLIYINKIKILKKYLLIILTTNNKYIIKNIPLNCFIIKKYKIGQTIILIIKKI